MNRTKKVKKDWSEVIRVVPYSICDLRIGVGSPNDFRLKYFPNTKEGDYDYAATFVEDRILGLCFDRKALRPGIIAHEISHVALYELHTQAGK